MVLTIIAVTAVFIVCSIFAYKAKVNYPVFTDEQLLSQHLRFLDELVSARKYVGATYFYEIEKGSQAEHELTRRGFDVAALLSERADAERENRDINWTACRDHAPPRRAIPGRN